MEWPAQQKTRMGGTDKRKVRRGEKKQKKTWEALTENIAAQLDELDNSDERRDEETV